MSKTAQHVKKNIHNALFLKAYSDLKYSLDLFRLTLSSEEYGLFDWENIESRITVFFDSEWKEKVVDLVFTVPMKETGESADMIFLLEHKSYQDPKLMQQLLNYQGRIYSQKKNPIIPILIYHGREPEWAGCLDFQGTLSGMTDDIRRLFGREILNFKLRLLNLHKLDIREGLNLATNPILFVLSNIWNLEDDELENLFRLCKNAEDEKGEETVGQMALNYLNQHDSDKYSWERLAEVEAKVFPKGGTLVEKLKEPYEFGLEEGIEKGIEKGLEEGIEKGLEEGRRTLAMEMLADGESIAKICKYTKLTEAEVEALKKRLD